MTPSPHLSRRLLLGTAAAALATTAFAQRQRGGSAVTVFAASSMTDVLQAIGKSFEADSGARVRFSFASSAAVARQIEAGAPADVVISADSDWMDYLAQRRLIRQTSRANLAGNQLVLIAPAKSAAALKIRPRFPLRAALGDGRLAIGDPAVVPAGRYAKAALTSLGVWNDVADRLVRAENVRSAMVFVARGETPLGIVYRTDALVEPGVRIVGAFPERSHPPIVYPAALTRSAAPGAADFLAYCRGPKGRAQLRRFGFVLP